MALVEVINHFALKILVGESREFILEDSMSVSPVLIPKLLFLNTSTQQIDLEVIFKLDYGESGDELATGSFEKSLLVKTIDQGEYQEIKFQLANLSKFQVVPAITHTIVLSNAGTEEAIVRFLLTGMFEELLHTNTNKFVKLPV